MPDFCASAVALLLAIFTLHALQLDNDDARRRLAD